MFSPDLSHTLARHIAENGVPPSVRDCAQDAADAATEAEQLGFDHNERVRQVVAGPVITLDHGTATDMDMVNSISVTVTEKPNEDTLDRAQLVFYGTCVGPEGGPGATLRAHVFDPVPWVETDEGKWEAVVHLWFDGNGEYFKNWDSKYKCGFPVLALLPGNGPVFDPGVEGEVSFTGRVLTNRVRVKLATATLFSLGVEGYGPNLVVGFNKGELLFKFELSPAFKQPRLDD